MQALTRSDETTRRALELPAPEVPDAVRAVIEAVPAWWHGRAGEAGLRGSWRDWDKALSPPPVELRGSGGADVVALGEFGLGEAYVEALEASVRTAHGRHYTPSALAGHLWALVRREQGHTFGPVYDPAAGAGALLLPVVRHLLEKVHDPAEAVGKVSALVAGRDLDPVAVWLGNAALAARLLPAWAAIPAQKRPPMPKLLEVADGLEAPPFHPAITIMNPPYGRVRLAQEERSRWADGLHGHANLYGLFLHAAVESLAEDGILAAVVPTSFLGGAYFKRLRALLHRHAPLVRVSFVGSRSGVYAGDPLQETCLVVFRRGAADRPVTVSRISTRPGGVADEVTVGQVPGPRKPERPWIMPRFAEDEPLVARCASVQARLSDHGWSVSTGPLVWNRHKTQLRSKASGATTPIVWASDISPDGSVRPSPSRDGQRHIALRPADTYMVLDEPAVLVQRTTAPEQPRRLVAGVLDEKTLREWGGRVVVENHVNVLRPRAATALTPEILAALLDSEPLDRLYRSITGSVAVSAYELEALPLPDPATVAGWVGRNRFELEAVIEEWYRHQAPAPGN